MEVEQERGGGRHVPRGSERRGRERARDRKGATKVESVQKEVAEGRAGRGRVTQAV